MIHFRTTLVISLITTYASVAGPVEEAWEAYLAGDFTRVEEIVAASVTDTSLSDAEIARLYLTLGCSDAMRGRKVAATAAFERALNLDPHMPLTSSDLPPPVWSLFQPIKDRISRQLESETTIPEDHRVSHEKVSHDTVRVMIPVTRSRASTIKSLVLPGWGHLSEGRSRGLVYIGLELVMVSGWVMAMQTANDAHDDYLRARSLDDMSGDYDRYNRYYQVSWGLGIGVVATYIIAQFDFFSCDPPVSVSIGKDHPGNHQVRFSIRL